MIELAAHVARRFVPGVLLGVLVVACQGPEAFYREEMSDPGQAGNGGPGTGGISPVGTAGTTGASGTTGVGNVVGTSGTTGSAGRGGTTGTAGTTGSAGTTGTAGTTGSAGTTGQGGSSGRGGTTGSAGTTAPPGRGGTTGSAGTGAGGTGGRGGSSGAAGTSGRGGGSGGAGGGATACPGCMPQVLQKCQSDTSMNAVPVTIKILNNGNQMMPLSDVTVRYWFSHTTTGTPVLEIDYSPVVPKTAITARFAADYLEVGFTSMAGTLFPFDLTAGTGDIQLRFHNTDYSNWNTSQLDDYSYQMCSGTNFNPWMKTTAYFRGTLVWGAEP